jgi:hypothetical protein
MVLLLVQHGARLNVQDALGLTPLHLAVNGQPDVLKQLLTLGADISIKDAAGQTAIVLAARLGRSAAIESFLTCRDLSAGDLLWAGEWATESQLDAADEVLAHPPSAAMQQQLVDTTDTAVALLDAAAAKDPAAAHLALCNSIGVPLPYHAIELLGGLLRALLKKGAPAADLAEQRADVQHLIIGMAGHYKQQRGELTAQRQELAQQREELEQMQHELAEQQRQVVQQLAQPHAAQEAAGPSVAAPAGVQTAGGKRSRLA